MTSPQQKSTKVSARLIIALFCLLALTAVPGAPTAVLGTAATGAHASVQNAASEDSLTGAFTTIDVPGATSTLPLDINAEGAIVGRYALGVQTHGFTRTPAGEFMTVDFPGASFTVAAGINDLGHIVGMYGLPATPTQRHGFLLKDGVFTTFDPPGSTFTNALGINERGDIVGRYCTLSRCRPAGSGDFRAFLLRDGEFTTLDAPGAIETNAFKINGSGKIAGGLVTAAGEEEIALWKKNELTMIALPNGKPVSMDNGGINESGDVVGLYCDSLHPCAIAFTGTHGFLINGDEFYTIDVPGASATAALGINARGDIVGGYFVSGGPPIHGFLLSRSQG